MFSKLSLWICLTLAASITCGPVSALEASEEWHTVKKWSGEGMKETDTFEVKSRKWRIKWKSYDEPFENAGILQIFVHKEDGTMVSLAANKQGPGQDVSYVRSGPGEHYLMISSANIKWEIEVQDEK